MRGRSPRTTILGDPLMVALPNLFNDGEPIWQEVVAAGDRLLIYEHFGSKLDRRREMGISLPGGLFVVEPSTGNVLQHFAPSMHFPRVLASSDGERIYGLDPSLPDHRGPVRRTRLDAKSGMVLAERYLQNDAWFITLAAIPKSFLTREDQGPIHR